MSSKVLSPPSPCSTLPPELKSKIVEWAWEMLLEEPARSHRPIEPNDTSSARAAQSLLSTVALVSKTWHAATLPFAVRHSFTGQTSLSSFFTFVQKYGLETAVRAVRIHPDATSDEGPRSLSDAYAPWIPLLSAFPAIQELSFESFTKGYSSAPPGLVFGRHAAPAFAQWPVLPLVRRLRLDRSRHYTHTLEDLSELSRRTPNLVHLELDPWALGYSAALPTTTRPLWPHLETLALTQQRNDTATVSTSLSFTPPFLQIIEAAAPRLVSFRVQGNQRRTPGGSPGPAPDCFNGNTVFPRLTQFDHAFPLVLPPSFPQPIFPVLTHLSVSFYELAPTPAIMTLFTPTLIEISLAILHLEGWVSFLATTCTTTPSLRFFELEKADAYNDNTFSLADLRQLAQVCEENGITFATSDNRVWTTDEAEMEWDEKAYEEGQPEEHEDDSGDDSGSDGTDVMDWDAEDSMVFSAHWSDEKRRQHVL
ncbi:hypothetical protein RQP46_008552 [Phenoliferia psychrophenolica]